MGWWKKILIVGIAVSLNGSWSGPKEDFGEDHKPCAFSLPSSLQRTQLLQSRHNDFDASVSKKKTFRSSELNIKKYGRDSKPFKFVLKNAQENTCPEFHKLEGEELVQAVLEAESSCLSSDVFYGPDENLTSLFTEGKMISLMRKFAELAGVYQGNNEDKIENFIVYIWAGYYNRNYHYNRLNEHFTDSVTSEFHLGLNAFVNNSYFVSTSEEHLLILEYFINMLAVSNQAVPYIDKVIYLLDHFSSDHPEEMGSVLFSVFEMYRTSHFVEDANNLEFINYILQGNTEPLSALIRFSRRENLIHEEESTVLLYKAVENVGHFLQYGDYPLIYTMAHSRIEELIRKYSMESDGGVLSFLASAAVDYWSWASGSELKPSCKTNSYDVCSYAGEWRDFLFRPEYTHTCQTTDEIKIKFMRDVPMAQRQAACEDLIDVDNSFHEKLKTNKIPLSEDKNTVLEAVIFPSSDDYDVYGGPLYGIDTDNGGLYIEGNPTEEGNIPRFFAYETGGENNLSIWNFRHEFVHYLDGRYIRSKGYGEYEATGSAVWWGEGLAEYIAKGDYHGRASSYVQQKIYKFSQLIPNGGDAVKVYYYGYLAVRFLVENFFHIAEELMHKMRNEWEGYVERVEAIGTSLDVDFSSYLDELSVEWADRGGEEEEEEEEEERFDRTKLAGEYCYAEPIYSQFGYIADTLLAGRRIVDHQNSMYSFSNEKSPIVIHSGSSYDLNITVGTTTEVYDDINLVEVWVDWNDDKIFSDIEKEVNTQVVLSKPGVFQTISQVLKVPETAGGYKRMRMRISYHTETYPDICSSYESGEIEDYVLSVLSQRSDIRVSNILGEVRSLLKVRKPSQTIALSEIFDTGDDRILTYTAVSSDSKTAVVSIEEDQLIIKKVSTQERTKPVSIVVAAEDSSGRYVKEFSVVFEPYTLPLVLSAEDERRESFVRVINNSNQNGVVHITARDDSGEVSGPVRLSLKANGASHFNSGDLERGNSQKGLIGSLGSGEGNWRITLESDLDFHASSYIRLKGDGFVTRMNELVDFEMNGGSFNYFVPLFNSASNRNQRSLLKLFNPNNVSVDVNIIGIDDQGHSNNVQLSLPPKNLRTLTSQNLESGVEGLSGSLGNGSGKRRLEISSSGYLDVMNLMENPAKHLSNLSYNPLSSSNANRDLHKLLMPAQDNRHGFIRIINHSGRDGEITITARDDSSKSYDPIQLSISAEEVRHFNSYDLQNGSAEKGFPVQGLGSPEGMWRLKFESDLDIQVLSYMRSSDGFLTSLDSVLPVYGNNQYSSWFFNPASNQNQKSYLYFINTHDETVWVSIHGVDDQGNSSGEVLFTLPAGSTKTLSALDLETGNSEGLRGSLGNGAGKWHLSITAGRPLLIMNLMESPNGYLSNLSMP